MTRTVSIDKYGRLGLGKDFADKTYLLIEQEDGSLLLKPGKFVSMTEAQILQDPNLRAALNKALEQAGSGNLLSKSNYDRDEFLFSEDATIEDINNEV